MRKLKNTLYILDETACEKRSLNSLLRRIRC